MPDQIAVPSFLPGVNGKAPLPYCAGGFFVGAYSRLCNYKHAGRGGWCVNPTKARFVDFPQHVIDRFWSKVDRSPGSDRCWLWQGCKDKAGYGQFGFGRVFQFRAHRLSWMITNSKDIPPGLFVCHSCDNPSCVNPQHLWVGTNRQNVDDAVRKGRLNIERTLNTAEIATIKSYPRRKGLVPYLARKFQTSARAIKRHRSRSK